MKLSALQLNEKTAQKFDGLYHYKIGFPADWEKMLPEGFSFINIPLTYSTHAQREALMDRYGDIALPDTLDITRNAGANIIELEILDNVVVKLVVRKRYDATRDVTIVFEPSNGKVRTVWFNSNKDVHKTLDTYKYNKPPKVVTYNMGHKQ